MQTLLRRNLRATIALLAVLALAVSACSSSGATTKPSATKTPHATASVEATEAPSGEATEEPSGEATEPAPTGDSSDPFANVNNSWSSIKSYKFTMKMQGPNFDSVAKMFSSTGVFEMSGTIVMSPTKSAYVKMGTIEMIQIGSDSWIKMGSTWSPTTSSSTSMADSMAPDKIFKSFSSGMTDLPSGNGIQNLGTATKNGVQAVHYKIDPTLVGESMAGVFGTETPLTWSFDMWMAKDGGYPVNMNVVGKDGSTTVAQLSFDISKVNDPGNKVNPPA